MRKKVFNMRIFHSIISDKNILVTGEIFSVFPSCLDHRISSEIPIEYLVICELEERELEWEYPSCYMIEYVSRIYFCHYLSESHEVIFHSDLFEKRMISHGEDLISESIIHHLFSDSIMFRESLEIFESIDFIIWFLGEDRSFWFYGSGFSDLCDEKSTRFIDMWPPFLLEKNFESSWIFHHHSIYNFLIFESIEGTGWVDHLTSDL